MLYVTIACAAAALLALIRLLLLKKEMRSLTRQLVRYNGRSTDTKLRLSFYESDVEAMAAAVNELIDRVAEAEAGRRRTENELKAAVASISHDLRTPLTSISGYIQLLESDGLSDEEKANYLAVTKNRTKRLQVLLGDFFELSVIESPDYELKPEPLKMNQLLSELLIGFYDRFNERGIVPSIVLPEEEVILLADESAVKRVVENLVANAVSHSTGPVSVTLEKRGASAVLTVENEAGHLTGTDLALLFDRFYTADRTRSGKGTGLGLSIAKSLMHKTGGRLTADLQGERLSMRCEWPLRG